MSETPSSDQDEGASGETSSTSLSAGGLGVLLVEEPPSREQPGLTPTLEGLGHSVVRAVNGASALVQFTRARDRGEAFDLMVVDTRVDGRMRAREIVDALRTLEPTARVLLVAESAEVPLPREGSWSLLTAPWTPARLAQALDRILTAR